CCRLACLNKLFHREYIVGSGSIIRACLTCLHHAYNPPGKITHVDELSLLFRMSWHQHFAALGDAIGPVGEAVGTIIRTNNESRTYYQYASRHSLLSCLLTQGL